MSLLRMITKVTFYNELTNRLYLIRWRRSLLALRACIYIMYSDVEVSGLCTMLYEICTK